MRWIWLTPLLVAGCVEIHPSFVEETSAGSTTVATAEETSGTEATSTSNSNGTGTDTGTGGNEATTTADSSDAEGTTSESDTGAETGGLDEHQVFVTEATWQGDFGGLAAGDANCEQAASDAGLMGTWKAILSTSNGAAKDRLAINGPIRDLDGSLIAQSAADLWDSSIAAPIDLTESLQTITGKTWTGTAVDGSTDPDHCQDFTVAESGPKGQKGDVTSTGSGWVREGFLICSSAAHLYCLSQ